MGFIMDGLDGEAYDRQYNDRDLVRRIVGYFKPEGAPWGAYLLYVIAAADDLGRAQQYASAEPTKPAM